MKLVSFSRRGEPGYGIWTDAGIVDLRRRLHPAFPTLRSLVAGTMGAAARALAASPPDHAHADVVLDKPLLDWGKCFCVGVNYPDRNAEYKDRSEAPTYPSLFVRFPESFVGPDMPIVRPPESPQLDYEGEVVLVIGKRGRRIPAAHWQDHIFGYTIGNEGTIRDWLRHGKFNVTQGKNFAQSGSLGPWIVPKEDVPPAPCACHARQRRDAAGRHDRPDDFSVRPHRRIHLDVLHARARRHRLHRYADGRGRTVRSAALADTQRHAGDRDLRPRRPAQHHRRRVTARDAPQPSSAGASSGSSRIA